MLNYREQINAKKTELQLHKQSKQNHLQQLVRAGGEVEVLREAREVFQKAAIITQNHLGIHLSTIVTKALQAVFYEKDISFKIEFIERRNSVETDMWVEENGHKYSLLTSRGFGMADIVSFALRVAYILLHTSDNILIIDEPHRNLGKDQHEVASQMIRELSKELGMQFIICTHSEEMISYADKSFYIKQNKEGVSIVKENKNFNDFSLTSH